MEIHALNTKAPQEDGAFLHLTHTKFGHLLYTGPGADEEGRLVDSEQEHEPIGVLVRGMEAPTVQAAAAKIEAAKVKKTDPIDNEEAGFRFCEVLVIEFRGLTKNGAPLEATKENIRAFFRLSDDLVTQVLRFARERSNFFGPRSSD
jgi:hypothetical protein